MSKAKIDLFFDVISPYSWIGFEALCRYRTVWQIELRLRPFFLGAIMKETNNNPPMMVPAKGIYMARDIDRMRDYWAVPLGHLSDPVESILTKGSLPANRFLISLDRHQPEKLESAARELWMRRWSRDEDYHLPEHLREVSRRIGLAENVTNEVISEMNSAEVKEKLKENTEEAIEEGAFGAPWIVLDLNGKKHSFFGSDRFHVIADMIGETFPGPLRELAKSKL